MTLFSLLFLPFFASYSAAYILRIWFDDAKFFVEYGTLFKFDKFLPHFKNFLKIKNQGSPYTYLEYIQENKDNFISRLVTCQLCLSAWISIFLWILELLFVIYTSHSNEFIGAFILLAPIYIFFQSYLSIYLYLKLKNYE